MKGKLLQIKDLKDKQLVWIEFDFSGITQCESDAEYETKLDEMREYYADEVYQVDLENKCFINADTETGFNFYFNLIGDIYEWIEEGETKVSLYLREDKDLLLGRRYNVEYELNNGKIHTFSNILTNTDGKYFWFTSKEDGLDVVKQDTIRTMICLREKVK
jgi:hypothetical protein